VSGGALNSTHLCTWLTAVVSQFSSFSAVRIFLMASIL